MNDLEPPSLAPTSSSPPRRGNGAALRPTFLKSLRGVWLLTWKSQLIWRRLPLGLFGLLVLPGLIFITTLSPESWGRHFHWVGNQVVNMDWFSRRLARTGQKLEPKQHAELIRIFAEEYARAEAEWRDKYAGATGALRQAKQLRAAHQRIRDRAEAILDDRQLAPFLVFEKMQMDSTLARVKEPPWGRLDPFYHWLIDFYFFVMLPLICVRACGGLIREEVQADTLGFLITRPLTRAQLLIVKYLTEVAWLEMVLLLETLLIFAAGGLRQVPALGNLLPTLLAAQFLAVPAWSALGIFLGQVTKRYVPLAIFYGFVVEFGIGRIPTNINTLSLMRHLKSLLGHNSSLQGIFDWTVTGPTRPVTALLLACVIFLGMAAFLFTVREYHHTTELQN